MGLRARGPFLAYRTAGSIANVLPAPVARVVARGLGVLFRRTMEGRRMMITRHLHRATRLSGPPLDAMVAAAFDSYARYWMESFRLATTTPAELEAGMSWEGIGRIEDALADGKGAVLALPHLGGWDFGGAWFAAAGYPVTVVVETLDPPELFAWFKALRERIGLRVVTQGEAASAVLRALRGNELVALLCDRDLERNGVEVDFFGESATLPAGPAMLAIRTGAPLLPAAVYFDGAFHRGVVRPPIPVERSGALREDIKVVTQRLAGELESLIRVAPDQWHLFQPNWPSDYEVDQTSRSGTRGRVREPR